MRNILLESTDRPERSINMNTSDQLLKFEKPTLNSRGGLQTTVLFYRDGILLFEDEVNLSRNIERRKLTEKLMKDFGMQDAEPQILKKIQDTRAELESAQLHGGNIREIEMSARFEGLVDIVDDEGTPKFLYWQGNKFRIETEAHLDGKSIIPPDIGSLPWLLPRKAAIEHHCQHTNIKTTFDNLIRYFKGISQLPTELHYGLLAMWVIHTYLVDFNNFSPYILLYANPDTL